METPQTQLIEYCNLYPEMRHSLKEVREFRLQTIRTMPREFIKDLEEEIGYEFSSNSLTQKRNEILNLVQAHPELMTNDVEQLMLNIAFYLNLDSESKVIIKKQRIADQRKRVKSQVQKMRKRSSAPSQVSSDSTIDSDSDEKAAPRTKNAFVKD